MVGDEGKETTVGEMKWENRKEEGRKKERSRKNDMIKKRTERGEGGNYEAGRTKVRK